MSTKLCFKAKRSIYFCLDVSTAEPKTPEEVLAMLKRALQKWAESLTVDSSLISQNIPFTIIDLARVWHDWRPSLEHYFLSEGITGVEWLANSRRGVIPYFPYTEPLIERKQT